MQRGCGGSGEVEMATARSWLHAARKHCAAAGGFRYEMLSKKVPCLLVCAFVYYIDWLID